MTRSSAKRSLLSLLLWWSAGALAADPTPQLVIIIDDLGYRLEAGKRAAALPGKINLSILPGTPNGPALARLGLATGKEILLHAPMSNVSGKPLGVGGLTANMGEQQLRETLATSLAHVPGVRGVSNHMGSQLTSERQPMEWVMDELAHRGLYYIDSRTTANSLAARVADERGVPNLSRHVFLDNEINSAAIHRRFEEWLARADRDGVAIAIGHPHDETLEYLQRELPRLEQRGYRLSLISEILAPRLANYQATADAAD